MTEELQRTTLVVATAEIVSAYVAHNQIATPDVATLVTSVAGELSKFGMSAGQQEEAKPEPAVPVRRSIGSNHLVCLVCGKRQKLLKRHLEVEHGLTPNQYRDTFKLKPDYPMTAPSYTQQRREFALRTGLGRPKKEGRRRKPTAAP